MQKDFLDNVKDDLPKDSWSLQTDSSKRIVNFIDCKYLQSKVFLMKILGFSEKLSMAGIFCLS